MTALDSPAIRALLEAHQYDEVGAVCSCSDFVQVGLKCDAQTHPEHVSEVLLAAAPSIVAQLVAVVERVEGLHVPVIEYGEPVGCKTCDWEVSGTWPCETIQAITGEGLELAALLAYDAVEDSALREARAKALEDAADEIDAQRDAANPDRKPDEGWSVIDHRAGRFLGKTVAARLLRARAAAERGGE